MIKSRIFVCRSWPGPCKELRWKPQSCKMRVRQPQELGKREILQNSCHLQVPTFLRSNATGKTVLSKALVINAGRVYFGDGQEVETAMRRRR